MMDVEIYHKNLYFAGEPGSMNYYEKTINSFLSSVSSNMSAVYLPAFFVSLIELLEDYYKFDNIPDKNHIKTEKTKVKVSYYLLTIS